MRPADLPSTKHNTNLSENGLRRTIAISQNCRGSGAIGGPGAPIITPCYAEISL